MGLFVNRPQPADELPALPGEPLQPPPAAEHLPTATPSAADLGSLAGTPVESIEIPLNLE